MICSAVAIRNWLARRGRVRISESQESRVKSRTEEAVKSRLLAKLGFLLSGSEELSQSSSMRVG